MHHHHRSLFFAYLLLMLAAAAAAAVSVAEARSPVYNPNKKINSMTSNSTAAEVLITLQTPEAAGGKNLSPFPHFWERCVGSDHASYLLRADFQKQLKLAHDELGFQMVRCHGLLTDDMNVVLKKDLKDPAAGVTYSFWNIDQAYDYLLSIGMKPIVELSFMPILMAQDPTRECFHYRGLATPPKNMDLWSDLIRNLTQHLVQRYGIDEVSSWYFEVWNEPNLDYFWPPEGVKDGGLQGYLNLYAATVKAIKSVNKRLLVGGPATMQSGWISEFMDFVMKNNVPCDFVSTHEYPTDIWPLDRDTMLKVVRSTRAKIPHNLPLFYTEWNSGLNDIGGGNHLYQDSSYPAAFIVKTLADVQPYVDMMSYWTFSDIFEEQGTYSAPFWGQFGMMTLHGVRKPVWRAFELLHQSGSQRINTTLQGATAPANVLSTYDKEKRQIMVFVTNFEVPTKTQQDASVQVQIVGRINDQTVTLRVIDENNANAFTAWQGMGTPNYPSAEQLQQLHKASQVPSVNIKPSVMTTPKGDVVNTFKLYLKPSSLHVLTIQV